MCDVRAPSFRPVRNPACHRFHVNRKRWSWYARSVSRAHERKRCGRQCRRQGAAGQGITWLAQIHRHAACRTSRIHYRRLRRISIQCESPSSQNHYMTRMGQLQARIACALIMVCLADVDGYGGRNAIDVIQAGATPTSPSAGFLRRNTCIVSTTKVRCEGGVVLYQLTRKS